MKHDSELHIPDAVADAMRALRPETRAKVSLRDIDDMTRPLRKRIAELEKERDEARAYLSRLLAHHAPGCEPLDDLLGVCTQIDNLLCGMMTVQEGDELRAERDALQKAFDARADEFAEMRRESWLMGVRLREARDEREDARRLVEMMRDDPGAIVPVPLPWESE